MTMSQQEIIQQVADRVLLKLEGEGSGHDWWHIYRVWNMAKKIGVQEDANLFVIELAALLHDIADWKFHDGDDTVGPRVARCILEEYRVDESVIDHVCLIIATTSFKGANVETPMSTREGMVVQDADRLDAIGALGVARTFAYGGNRSHLMHHPGIKPIMHDSKEDYFQTKNTTINHFYEKLLLLKDRMNTEAAKVIAEERHRFMEAYLAQFLGEWDGEM